MTYRKKLIEIIGEDHLHVTGPFIGGVYNCPSDAFTGVFTRCPNNDFIQQDDKCRACWNQEYQGEEFNPEYLED